MAQPRYPIYIVSKGRSDTQMTSRVLDGLDVPHFVVVEEAELGIYRATAPASATFLTLDPEVSGAVRDVRRSRRYEGERAWARAEFRVGSRRRVGRRVALGDGR